MSEVKTMEYDLELIKKGFNRWIDKWKESVIDEEFNNPQGGGGIVQKIEDEDSLRFKFITEFNFSITKPDNDEDQ